MQASRALRHWWAVTLIVIIAGRNPAESAPYGFVNLADSTGPLAFDAEDAQKPVPHKNPFQTTVAFAFAFENPKTRSRPRL